MSIKAVVFDLDGTLLDTLADLADAVNYALGQMNFKERTVDEVRRFIGNGVETLMRRAVPTGTSESETEQALSVFRTYYAAHCQDKTALYEGIIPMLATLKKRGIKIGIASNKTHAVVAELKTLFFDEYVDSAIGENEAEGVHKKPSPDMINLALQELDCKKEEAFYVGDSEVDIETAKRCGIQCISVTWGYRDHEFLEAHGASEVADSPEEIISYI